jgi:hypothetical protein
VLSFKEVRQGTGMATVVTGLRGQRNGPCRVCPCCRVPCGRATLPAATPPTRYMHSHDMGPRQAVLPVINADGARSVHARPGQAIPHLRIHCPPQYRARPVCPTRLCLALRAPLLSSARLLQYPHLTLGLGCQKDPI